MVVALASMAALLTVAMSAALLLSAVARAERLATRLRIVSERGSPAESAAHASGVLSSPLVVVSAIGRAILSNRMLSPKTLRQLEDTLVAGGFRPNTALPLFIGVKLSLLLVLPVATGAIISAAGILRPERLLIMLAAAALGLVGPDMMIRRWRQAYLKRLDLGIPDALDMMVICAEAGLGLEPIVSRVGHEIRHAHQAMADELDRLASELRLMSDTRAALIAMGARTGLPSLIRLGTTLAQSVQYGTPVSQALRTLSAELRQELLTRFEERAARLPVLLTMPMILFILPTVFLIVGGPAAIQVVHSLNSH